MVDAVIFGHGVRGPGTATGTYLVPEDVKIYFFATDGQLLHRDGAMLLMSLLCSEHPRPDIAKIYATEKTKQHKLVPNYICYHDNDLGLHAGIYQVGRNFEDGPWQPISPNGMNLSTIIGGQGTGGVIGNRIYWLCCRAKPLTTDNPLHQGDDAIATGGRIYIQNANVVAADVGLTPSEVKRLGRWI